MHLLSDMTTERTSFSDARLQRRHGTFGNRRWKSMSIHSLGLGSAGACSNEVLFSRIQRLRLKMKESQKHMAELDKHLYVLC